MRRGESKVSEILVQHNKGVNSHFIGRARPSDVFAFSVEKFSKTFSNTTSINKA